MKMDCLSVPKFVKFVGSILLPFYSDYKVQVRLFYLDCTTVSHL